MRRVFVDARSIPRCSLAHTRSTGASFWLTLTLSDTLRRLTDARGKEIRAVLA
jgi:hypothetical protein